MNRVVLAPSDQSKRGIHGTFVPQKMIPVRATVSEMLSNGYQVTSRPIKCNTVVKRQEMKKKSCMW